MARLAAEPALIPTAVEEFLRHSAPIQIFGRNASHDLSRCTGARCRPATSSRSASARQTATRPCSRQPDELRLDRRPNKHLTFGAGPHLCAGAGVARMEMAVTLETLIETGIGLALDPAAAPRWKTRGDRRGLSSLPLIIKKKTTD